MASKFMIWQLINESVQQQKLSRGSSGCGSFSKMEDVKGTSTGLIYSVRYQLYQATTRLELPHFGKMKKVNATLIGMDREDQRWKLQELRVFKTDKDNYPLLGWEGNAGIAMLLQNLQGNEPHSLDYPEGIDVHWPNQDEYMFCSTTDSPRIRKYIKRVLKDLDSNLKKRSNLWDIVNSNLLR